MIHDPICAIATSPGISALGIIRCSGEGSWEKLLPFVNVTDPKPWRLYLTPFTINGEMIDEVMIAFYKSPKSYTGEDMVELISHGSPLILRIILQELIKVGFRQALPGEFTKRAVLNGKMDLIKAESIETLVSAHSKKALKAALSNYSGRLSQTINRIRETLLELLAKVEVELNYPDEIEGSDDEIIRELEKTLSRVKKLIRHGENGIVAVNGVKTVIAGRTNVGKSTLLNALLRRDRAIVTDIPGTTRDTIEEDISINGIYFRLVDTAGIRESSDKVERIGIERSLKQIKEADLVLFMVDLIEPENDLELYEKLRKEFRHSILIGNKLDMVEKCPDGFDVCISAKTGRGIDKLENLMVERTQDITELYPDEVFVTERQLALVQRSVEMIEEILEALKSGITPDVVGSYLQQIIFIYDELTGRYSAEDLLDKIFGNFCVGK
ncbi:tRNA uridine-5-carboxymethylaminomethyl(34) synthesis GTPase MnmE [Kosmotoga olearia]|uniref:tRNA modification GTPase MnmE n=3 Tax=Kosmotoga TaxID=651456 RepID=C5CIQ0_KOSOT|nr:tRNA uridine-5-carboxymethylaminomethyl(34) synthesis GTPase MnmE [Kosmotoga olearia]ACR80833.1 tRNA modification GTPase TrmE [Kosmotoga olearia TBF 19.5.1]MDK2952683.1 tRNA modification GTPase [Kosmotoga sp.]OAA19268.1 hypothetical protein DU53_11735 [Kosmotoga sp. DU53]